MKNKGCLILVLIAIGILALLFLSPAITMWLWNWVAVNLFAVLVINYWQAMGLSWLCTILFKSNITVNTKK